MSPLRSRSPRAALARVLLLLFALLAPAWARAQTDVIRGRVTNTEGLGLPNVRVTATSIPGSVVREVRTDGKGAFRIVFPGGTGDYLVAYALIGYGPRQQQVKRLLDEAVLVADVTLSVMQLDTIAVTASTPQRVERNSRTPDVGGTEQQVPASLLPPDQQGDLAAMAASLPGVLLVPGSEGTPDGFSVLGLGADQNLVTLNGVPIGANGLPRDASLGASLTTSPYDVSRGGFSGAAFNLRSSSGSNFRNRGSSLVLEAPPLQWSDQAARAVGAEYTNLSLGGLASGPLQRDRSFYNVSYQLGRRARDNASLLDASPLGLRTAGLAEDSVARFLDVLARRGVPVAAGPAPGARLSDNGSLLGSLDFSPPSSTSGQSVGLTVNGNWSRQHPVGSAVTQLASASGDRYDWGGGLQLRHSGYLKLLLSESSVGLTTSSDWGRPYVALPAGRVRVTSVLPDGSGGVQSLAFGGSQGLFSRTRSAGAAFQNSLSWFDDANRHRLKLSTELQWRGTRQDPASNLLGTFAFNSLQELEAGTPASFTRTLAVRARTTGVVNGAVSLGDTYRRSDDLQLQYGVRVDGSHYTTLPGYNPAVERVFGRRNDRVPAPIAISPRLGFARTLGRSNELAAFTGAARAPRAVLRGGIGVFASSGAPGLLGGALQNTGLPSGVQQLVCVGPAAPVPDWEAYLADPSRIPGQCADGTGGAVFSDAVPAVTLVDPGYRPSRAIRGTLSWNGAVLDGRFAASVEATLARNLGQPRTVDLNFGATPRFTLADEGRPVFVAPTSIVTTTGAVAARDARRSAEFSRVTEVRSDLESRTGQLSLRLSPIVRGPSRFGWSAAYTFTHVREQVAGFASTAGDPWQVEWSRAGQGPHQVVYSIRWLAFGLAQVVWNGAFRSGAYYTPLVGGDANGDGYGNDRAFVYAPAAAPEAALGDGMRTLLATTSGAARACLERQLGTIAARNSCRAPWSSTANVNVTIDRVKFRLPQRTALSVSLSNPLGAADLALHGSGRLRGWGQGVAPDPTLLYVRGFDPQANRFRYEVNQRFGASRPQLLALRAPVSLTVALRVDLGPVRLGYTLPAPPGLG